ncbi:MAG TPA: hypothetical protein VH833_03935, partial [Gemmatimonadales bacterium]
RVDAHLAWETPVAFRKAQTTIARRISKYKEGYCSPHSNFARFIDLEVDPMMRKVSARVAAR